MAEVRLENVKKIYENGFVAIAGASFSVAEGELVVLVGPSGCGKSTLLRMIAGLEPISDGTLTIDGRVVNDLPPKDRDIAMVFQSYALYPHMTVAENLGFGLSLRGTPRDEMEGRVRQAAEQLGLMDLLDRRPAQLSGGQRQRVALGRALVRAPKVFLLDEPLSNLDAKLRLATRTQIARLQRKLGATMVYVTHDQIEAMTLGHRIVVLEGGVIQQIGPPMEIYRQPANLFVAGFFGSPAMNFLRGRLDADGVLHGGGGAWDVGALLRAQPGLQACVDSEVVLGVRPEDLRPTLAALGPQEPPSLALAVDAFVEYVEPVGNEAFLNLRFFGEEWVARVAPESLPAAGSRIALACDPAAIHCFDGATGARIQLSR